MKGNDLSRRVRALSLAGTALAAGWLAPLAAQAQDAATTPAQPTAGTSPAPIAGDPLAAQSQQRTEASPTVDAGIQDIIVTAEKRAEGLQNIPIPITAVLGETLTRAGVREVGDLTQLAPSLQFGTRSTNVFIALRGIGQAGQDIGSQSGVTVSLDGVPLLNHFMMNPAFLDLERVEVLRGPQGTIAGRNATGGAINIYSKAPTDETSGDVTLTVGNYSRAGLKGYVNGPLGESVAVRVSAQVERADGWSYNRFLDRRNDDTDLAQVRGQLLYRPSDTLSVRALVDYTRDRSDPSFNVLIGRAIPDVPTVVELPGYAFPRNDIQNLDFYFNNTNQRDVEDIRATLIASLDIGSVASLTSTTGYIRHDIDLTDLDNDLTPANTSSFPLIGLYAKQFTQEFTLTADIGSRADVVAGLFYMHGDASEPLYLSSATAANYVVYLPNEKLDSYAGYAQLRYSLFDNVRATVGGRYTIDRKSYFMDATVFGAKTFRSDKDTWKAFTPRFVLDYTPNANSLVYASVSRGFKSGGFNTLGDIAQPVNVFDPEYVWNYEVGVKATMFDKRLRFGVTAFYADYTNLQATVFRINQATQVRYPKVENSSTATIKGVEFEAEAAPVTGLKLTGAVTFLDAKYGKFCNNDPLYPASPTDPGCVGATAGGQPLPPGALDLTGNQLTQAPRWQFNTSAQYVVPVSDRFDVTARADYKWQDRVYFDIYNHPLNAQAGYGLLNASLALGTSDGNWALTGWIRNAFDKRYISQGVTRPGANPYTSGSIGIPRMYGLSLYHRF